MDIGSFDYRDRLGGEHSIVNVLFDYLLSRGAANRGDAERLLGELPPGFGEPSADERAAVLDRFSA